MTRICNVRRSSGLLAGMVWLGMALGGAACAEQVAEPRAVVEAYLAALNDGSVATIRNLLDDDYQVVRPGARCAESRKPVECEVAWIEGQWIRDKASFEAVSLRVEREIVRASLAVRSESIRAMGADRIRMTKEFVVQNGRILSILPTLHTDDPQTAEYRRQAALR